MGDDPSRGKLSYNTMISNPYSPWIDGKDPFIGSGSTYGAGSSGGGSLISFSFLNDLFAASSHGAMYSGSEVSQMYNVYQQLQVGDSFQTSYRSDGSLNIVASAPVRTGIILPEITVTSTSQISSAVKGSYDSYWDNERRGEPKVANAEQALDRIMSMGVGTEMIGREFAGLNPKLSMASNFVKGITRTKAGFKINLTLVGRVAMKAFPITIKNGSEFNVTSFMNGNNRIYNLNSPGNKIYFGRDLIDFNIYLDNNKYSIYKNFHEFMNVWK